MERTECQLAMDEYLDEAGPLTERILTVFEEHKVFKLKCNDSDRIWRYVDFTKYVAMLEDRALWFSRADCLGDPFDSELPNPVISRMKEGWEAQRNSLLDKSMPENLRQFFLQQLDSSPDFWMAFRRQFAVNCWHQNAHESAAMWSHYLKSSEGVAIVTTPRKLKEAINDTPFLTFVGSVEYVDFDSYPHEGNIFERVLRKRMSFEHEKEVRAVAVKNEGKAMSAEPFADSGINVHVDLSALIDAVYVAPTAQAWLEDLVRKVTRRCGLRCEVRRSSLAEVPIW